MDARVGEVPGEYCPGEYSVNAARPAASSSGIGQRVIKGAAHIGGVIVVAGRERVRDVLVPVYEALGLEWDPATAGSVEDEVGPVRDGATSTDGRCAPSSRRATTRWRPSSTRQTLALARAARARTPSPDRLGSSRAMAATTGAQQIRDLVAERHRADAGRLRRAHGADRRARRLRHRLHLRLLGVSAARLGEPDFGFLTQTEMADAARAVCRVSNAPVIVDADTGYGNAVNVMRTVRDFQDAGAAGVFLEDQVWPKKCGHFQGKQVVPTEEHAAKIRAAADARGERDLFIVARTDARQPLGLEAAIERCLAYKEAGADALFVEAPQSVEELERDRATRCRRRWSRT